MNSSYHAIIFNEPELINRLFKIGSRFSLHSDISASYIISIFIRIYIGSFKSLRLIGSNWDVKFHIILIFGFLAILMTIWSF